MDGCGRVPFSHPECCSSRGSLLAALGLIVIFLELNVSYLNGVHGRSSLALISSHMWESGGTL